MKCLLCHVSDVIEFINLGQQPLANKYPAGEQDFKCEDFFPLQVFFCPECRNIQLGTIVPRDRMFQEYYYLSSVNNGLVRHFEKLAISLTGARFVVDIGSNDGILLKPLKEIGVKAIGVDPSVNVSNIANDSGLTTIVSFFNMAVAKQIVAEFGNPDIVVASSVFTHIENPHEFIKAIDILMNDDGVFIIEVEYSVIIIRDVQFERFYLDRIFYYSVTSLKYLFEIYGMCVVDVEKIEPHGGSIRVFVRKGLVNHWQISERVNLILQEELASLTIIKLGEFREKSIQYVNLLKAKLLELKRLNFRVAGYGAPARVATICNFGGIGTSEIEFIIDDSVLKHNKFSPGTHIPIFPFSHLENITPDVFLVFAYEYMDDIVKKTGGAYKYFIPIPPREVQL